MGLDTTKYSHLTDEEVIRMTHVNLHATDLEVSLAIRLEDALDDIRRMSDWVDHEKLNS